MVSTCKDCGLPASIDRSFRGRIKAIKETAIETEGDRDKVYRIARYLGGTHIESADLSLWAVKKFRQGDLN